MIFQPALTELIQYIFLSCHLLIIILPTWIAKSAPLKWMDSFTIAKAGARKDKQTATGGANNNNKLLN
jgi:hypothetical protein